MRVSQHWKVNKSQDVGRGCCFCLAPICSWHPALIRTWLVTSLTGSLYIQKTRPTVGRDAPLVFEFVFKSVYSLYVLLLPPLRPVLHVYPKLSLLTLSPLKAFHPHLMLSGSHFSARASRRHHGDNAFALCLLTL